MVEEEVARLLRRCPTKVERATYEGQSGRWERGLKKKIDSLAKIGSPAALLAIDTVRKKLEDKLLSQAERDPYIFNRRDAIYALGHIMSRKAVPFLRTMLLDWLHYESFSDTGECLRTAAAYALGRIEDPGTASTLAAALELDEIDLNPKGYIARGLSIREGLEECGAEFARGIIQRYDKGDIDRGTLRHLLNEASDKNRHKRIAPLSHVREWSGDVEARSCAHMALQAQELLKKLPKE